MAVNARLTLFAAVLYRVVKPRRPILGPKGCKGTFGLPGDRRGHRLRPNAAVQLLCCEAATFAGAEQRASQCSVDAVGYTEPQTAAADPRRRRAQRHSLFRSHGPLASCAGKCNRYRERAIATRGAAEQPAVEQFVRGRQY